ncbi:MAG: type VI secretion system baseplate subunit TssE [Candidatus Thiodiazotropha sp.]|jgi:type VI secretion system protein ImpF
MDIPVRNKSSSQQEQLQPSLLDRLLDDEPGKRRESHDKRVISMRRLRQCVLRDLAWLLNTTHLASTEDLNATPAVARSVLNYGIGELSGQLVSSMDFGRLEHALRQSILDFEPRILPQSLRVRPLREPAQESHNRLVFEIEGQLWAVPAPSHLLLRTEIDLDEGEVTLTDALGQG